MRARPSQRKRHLRRSMPSQVWSEGGSASCRLSSIALPIPSERTSWRRTHTLANCWSNSRQRVEWRGATSRHVEPRAIGQHIQRSEHDTPSVPSRSQIQHVRHLTRSPDVSLDFAVCAIINSDQQRALMVHVANGNLSDHALTCKYPGLSCFVHTSLLSPSPSFAPPLHLTKQAIASADRSRMHILSDAFHARLPTHARCIQAR